MYDKELHITISLMSVITAGIIVANIVARNIKPKKIKKSKERILCQTSGTTFPPSALHRRIFDGVFKHAGKIRDYDITKKEWGLANDTVH